MLTRAPRVLSRSAEGRWLGGVCAGLARARQINPAWIRAAFVAAALVGGLGILVYLSCWLILPQDGEAAEDSSSGWIVVLAQACAIFLGILTLGAGGAVATLFGFGWIVAGLGAVILLGVLVSWPRLGPAWAVLPIAALTVPSLAVAASGLQLSPQVGHMTVSPRSLSPSGQVTFRAGLGTTLIDLRRTVLPASGVVTVHIDGGVRRTIVALPENRCVHVALAYDVHPFLSQVAAQMAGKLPLSGVELFGNVLNLGPGMFAQGPLAGPWLRFAQGPLAGPWLRIDFTSGGGSLYVRNYPDAIDPDVEPNWPGYRVFPEPRPDIRGVPRRGARRLIAAWRVRHAAEVHSRQIVDSLMPGPCTVAGGPR